MTQPEQTDFLTDEESDSEPALQMKIPALKDLIAEFETEDPVLTAEREKNK